MVAPGGSTRDDEGYRLWRRLLDGDPVAPSDLAMTYLFPLCSWLERHFPRVSEHDRSTAADEAIISLIVHPTIYKPERQTLAVFLRISAAADLKNLLRAEDRHAKRRASLEAVEVSHFAGKYVSSKTGDPAALVEEAELEAEHGLVPGLEGLSPEDRQVLRLMGDGERRTPAYAVALGITDLPPGEQAREVKRAKDRLKKRLERSRGHHG